jgi:hypothetical protein
LKPFYGITSYLLKSLSFFFFDPKFYIIMSAPADNTLSTQTDKLIVLNAGSQLSIKLDGDNYTAWRIQLSALLTGFDLFGYVDGSNIYPPKVVANSTTTNPAQTHWTRQDQLILHGIDSSVTATVVTHLIYS